MSKMRLPLFPNEPDESRLEPVNDLLDRIERDAQQVLEVGGEVALRHRLARLLGPEPSPATAVPGMPVEPPRRAGRRRAVGGA